MGRGWMSVVSFLTCGCGSLGGLMVVGMRLYVMMSGSWGHCQSGVCSLALDSGDDFGLGLRWW